MLRALLALLFLWPGPAQAGAGLRVLCPPENYRPAGDGAWLVVASGDTPTARLDGRPVGPFTDRGGFHHLRLAGIRPEGAVVEVEAGGETVTVCLGGAGTTRQRLFHGEPPQACGQCHDYGPAGCTSCHRWEGTKHSPLLAEGCERCHRPPGRRPVVVAEVCAGCHSKYGPERHPRLRHAVSSDRDPSRPGRKMDCVSCHDPHAPRCLSCLGRAELRSWCRKCHGGP